MTITTLPARNSSRTGRPYNPGRRHRADFARAAVYAEFGYRHERAVDYVDFVDRRPDQAPLSAPGARLK